MSFRKKGTVCRGNVFYVLKSNVKILTSEDSVLGYEYEETLSCMTMPFRLNLSALIFLILICITQNVLSKNIKILSLFTVTKFPKAL